MRRRFTASLRWIVRPWRSVGLILALIAAFALPAFMAASADLFLVGASDSITRQVLDDDPTGLDVTVTATGRLAPSAVAAIDAAMRDQVGRVDRLGAPVRTVYTDLSLQTPSPDGASPPQAIIGSAARFVARDGAIDALDIVDGDRSVEGIWISARLSDRLDLHPGSEVAVAGSDPLPVAGVFADLWDGERDRYWDDVPPAVVPTYSRVFTGPLFEAIFVPEPVLLGFGVDGIVRWDSGIIDHPESYAELVDLARRTRGLERSYTQSTEMAGAIGAFSGEGGPVPVLATDVFDLRTDVEAILAQLDQPIATAAIGGIVLGLIVTAAGAAFAVRKRETEVRLLRADGDAAWRFAARALAQFAMPAVVGAVVGVAAALVVITPPGGSARSDRSAIDVGSIAVTALIGLAVAATVTAAAAARVLHTERSRVGALRLSWFLPVVGVAAAAWVQVGSAGDSAEVDPLVIAFPLIGLIAGVGLVVLAAHWLMRRIHRTGGSLPLSLFLAWRRITSADSGAVLMSVAMGIALGLLVFSTSLVDSLDTATEAKATTVVGGATQARINGPYNAPLPESTTVVLAQTTRLAIGREPVNIIAIDSETYADGASWDPLFGSSAEALVDALGTPVDADAAAVAVGRFPISDEGGFGTSIVTSYEVVDSVAAAPLTPEVYPTLVVDAGQVVDAARRDHEGRRPVDADPDEWDAAFRSPLALARPILLSQLDRRTLDSYLVANDVAVREVTTLSGRKDLVGNRAARWTFEYLGLLAAIAGLAAVGTLFFYLSEQRTNRQLSTVMAERMGLRRGSAAAAAVGEVLGLVLVAFAAGTTIGLVLAARIFDRFEPDPRLVPDTALVPPWSLVAALGVAATVVVVVAALISESTARRRSYGEVLRGT